MKCIFTFCFVVLAYGLFAQGDERIINPQIHTVKLYKSGDFIAFPMLSLGSNDVLELHFDDLDKSVKQYYYAFQLCNADWTPAQMSPFDYTKGFQNVRITNYRSSSIAATAYTHYQATIPDRNSTPTRSGNYLLKVFLNNDTTQLQFVKRFVVTDAKAAISAQVQQPFNARWFRTHQKIQLSLNVDSRLRIFAPQDVKVVLLQNGNWQTALPLPTANIFRGNYFDWSDEAATTFPALREWRWLDMRSLRLKSDRMQDLNASSTIPEVVVRPDAPRGDMNYLYYADLNGRYTLETLEGVNPFWQGDYANVLFSFVPPSGKALEGRDVYLFGEFTNWGQDAAAKMDFNVTRGVYEKALFLKQGYYNYMYATWPDGKKAYPDMSETEGNYWSTENVYTVLVYYRAFGARADELIGAAQLSSITQRTGL